MRRLLFISALLLLARPLDAQAREGASFVASSRGQVYYPIACDAWRSIPPANLRYFRTAAEAVAVGLRPTTNRSCVADSRGAAPSTGSAGSAGSAGLAAGWCTVARIVDGDTVDCAESARNARLILIDAPELDQGDFGGAARSALSTLLPVGSRARVEFDVERQDRYQRDLVYLYLPDGRMVNEEMARLGYVVVSTYPPNVRHVDRMRAAAEEARRSRRGLWSGSAFECRPADFRAGRCN